jgi:sarcosine oxidase
VSRVAVVGAGIMGAASAYELARRGHEVTILEQFEVGHARGSSHGRSRIVRLAYADVEWVRLAQESLRRWREVEAETGETLLELTGLVELNPLSLDALEACGIPWQELDAGEAAARFDLRLPAGARATLQQEAGIVHADRAHRALLGGAVSRGATLRERTPVADLGDVDADVVVVTAGGWAKALLADQGIELPVETARETVAYLRLASSRVPPSVVSLAVGGHGFYALADSVHGLKVGYHQSGRPADPDDDGGPDEALARRVAEWAGGIFELAAPEPVALDTCIYTNTSDERFILERHGRIVVGSACSGHGFKFAPAVGARLADLAGGS